MARLIADLVLILALAWQPAAAETVADLPAGERGLVATVIDGDTVRLDGGDADIRLIGLQAPKLPLGRKGFKVWPLADEARRALESLVGDRAVSLHFGETRRDRAGRTLAHLVRDDGLWVQGEMLRLGWARMYTFADNRRLAAEMRALELNARTARRGIWANPYYAVRRADDGRLMRDAETFQIVTGKVVDVGKVRDRWFLNFGEDFRTDFTVSIAKRDWPAFEQAGVNLDALEGAEIEARGWIAFRGGPAMEASHPEQIVVIERAAAEDG